MIPLQDERMQLLFCRNFKDTASCLGFLYADGNAISKNARRVKLSLDDSRQFKVYLFCFI